MMVQEFKRSDEPGIFVSVLSEPSPIQWPVSDDQLRLITRFEEARGEREIAVCARIAG